MNPLGVLFAVAVCTWLLRAPRERAALPLLACTMYITLGQVIQIGPANFTILRVLVFVGFVRILSRGERIDGGLNRIDKLVLLWAFWLLASSAFHTASVLTYRAGLVWTELGCYFLLRVFLRNLDDVSRTYRSLSLLLLPLALLMLLEKATAHNLFGYFGGVDEASTVRDGKVRASGPFAHAILAGTVGAACIPMAIRLWSIDRWRALAGLFSSVAIVFASTSSGPILMTLFSLLALVLWRHRARLRTLRWLAAAGLVALDLAMQDPVYFLMARIDITGGSTGYHRAQLIRSAIEHLDEWWLFGTDHTRHWMATGIYANSEHTDITNHVLAMGVMGGLPLMLVFMLLMASAFRTVGSALKAHEHGETENSRRQAYAVWTLGATLFGLVVNFMTISLFDQSVVFLYLTLASIAAAATPAPAPARSRPRGGRAAMPPVPTRATALRR